MSAFDPSPVATGPTIPQAMLAELQHDIHSWSTRNFGANIPITGNLLALLRLTKAVGEYAHAMLKLSQGIRGTPAEHAAAMIQAREEILSAAIAMKSSMAAADNQDWPVNISAYLGVIEEVGEGADAILGCLAGTGGFDKIDDSIADMFVFGLDFMARNNRRAEEVLNKTWAAVRTRDWLKNNKTGE